MKGGMDYLLGQVLSLIFYIMTLVIYYRARKEYVGGKIAAAMKLIIIFLIILFLADFVDYFFIMLLPLDRETVLILKILLKLLAICVLFFGGLRFFVRQRVSKPPARRLSDTARAVGQDTARDRPKQAGPAQKGAALDGDGDRQPTLGRYEILEQIGRGAMGIVYKGRDPKLNRLTAIKTIRFIDEFDDDQAEIIKEHFYHEAEVVAKLSHPNIVTVFDVGEDLDLSYLAMEYLEGQSLDKFTRPAHLLDLGRCLDIVIQVCDALAYAHDHDIIHRDIKPENIMVLKDGTVKVTDFGIARVTTSTKTRTGVIKGTPYYMSPEQTKGIKLTGPSDIFSLGVIFYQLLTGHLPFTGQNMAAIMYQTTSADPEPPTTYNPDIDPAIVAILERALAKQLDARYASAQEMGDQLRLFRNNLQDIQPGEDHPRPLQRTPESESGMVTAESIELDGIRLEMDAATTLETPRSETGTDETVGGGGYDPEQTVETGSEHQVAGPEITAPEMKQAYPPSFDWDYDANQETGSMAAADSEFSESVIERVGTRVKITENFFARFTTLIIIGSFAAILLSGVFYLFWHPSAADAPYDEEIEAKLEAQKRQIQAIQAKIAREKKAGQTRLAKEAEADTDNQARQVPGAQTQSSQAQQAHQSDQTQQNQVRREQAERAEQERLARIEQARQEEQARLARIEQAKREEQERLARIEQTQQAEQARQARIERERLAQQQQAELALIADLVSDGRTAWQRQDYRAARKHYEAALKKVTASAFKTERRFVDYKNEIEAALKDEDIIYGAKGYIKYQNRWMSPQDYETALFQEGYVKYRGELIHYTGLRATIEQVTEPDVNMFLTLRYKGQRVHTKNIQFRRIVLNRSTGQSSEYTAYYDWEVWTFNNLDSGRCALNVAYDIATDNWRIVNGCE